MRSISNMRSIKIIGNLACLLVFMASASLAQTTTTIPHLDTARQLVSDLQQGALVNEYGSSPTFLRWNHPTHEARTVCATFIAHLLEHTYSWKAADIKQWLGATGADASEWHEAIVGENGFRRLQKIGDIHPGDFLAISYHDGSADTGHIMVVNAESEHMDSTAPNEQGTEQYRVEVIDSSASGHGQQTRATSRMAALPAGSVRGYFGCMPIPTGASQVMHGARRQNPRYIKARRGI